MWGVLDMLAYGVWPLFFLGFVGLWEYNLGLGLKLRILRGGVLPQMWLFRFRAYGDFAWMVLCLYGLYLGSVGGVCF